jgi:predicted TIM-barrel fold metal-dependent hydrolase
VLSNCRFASEPVDEPERAEQVLQIAGMMHAERTLVFSTDYPHWDGDSPSLVFKGFPEDLRRRIYRDNAVDTFGSRLPSHCRP